jgi:ankyrin repeat protein
VLIDHGADVNAVDNLERTVLHTALKGTSSPDVEVIQLLLSKGVDANKRDRHQQTALDYAVTRSESDDLVKILFNATAHDQLMSTDYVTFLHYAVYEGNCFAVELFLESGLDLDKIDVNNEKYPLYFAVKSEHLRRDLLLQMTEFIQACKISDSGQKDIIKFLGDYFSKGFRFPSVSLFNINLFIFQIVTVLAE